MLRDAWFLTTQDTLHMFRSREVWMWAFVMPILFIYFIGSITGSYRNQLMSDPIAIRVGPQAGFLAEELTRRLEARGYRLMRPQTDEDFAQYRLRLTIPANFTDTVLADKPVKLDVERTGGGDNAEYDRFRLARATYTLLADLMVLSKSSDKPSAADFTKLAQQPRALTLHVEPAGKRVFAPAGFEQSVPGTMVMFTLLVLFTAGGVSLVTERTRGMLRRLASSPMSRGAVVLGKWGSRMALAVIQIALAMTAGSVLFGLRWGPNLPIIALVLLVYGALAAALGILLANFAKTDRQVIGYGVLASNFMAALGGCWWPIEITPRWAQSIAMLLPTGWAMDALHKLVSFGAPPQSVLGHLVALAVSALIAGYLVARWFRFE
jgi:ABC-2 type transport system permease protein